MNEVKTEWQDFNTHITKWAGVNNQAVELSKELIAMDMTQPDVMKQHVADFEIGHNALLAKTGKLLLVNTPFEGGTNETDCTLGKWMQNMDTTNPEMVALVNQLKPVHAELHQNVAKIKTLVANGQQTEAKDLYEKKLYPASEQVFATVRKMDVLAETANQKFIKMNTLLLQEGATHQTSTFAAIDKMVEAVGKNASTTVDSAHAIAARGRLITIVCLVAGIVLAIVFGFLLTRLITKPLFKGVDLAKAMADGDLTKTMDVDQKDEIGILAKSLNEMAVNLRGMFGDINNGVGRVDESSTQLAAIANQMSAGAESTATRSAQVAAAAEEMNATINEISSNSGKAKEITSQAVKQSIKASERVNELGKAADQINKVTETITEISEQTNLLALNATIEAARAGEAGKGFAVVANEIKELAKQTAAATLDIKTKIQGVQEATGVTVKEINEIGEVITDVDKIVATIAAAVEEQTATTKEIAQNVHQASQGIAEVNENVAQSSTVSAEIASDIATVNSSANEMNQASGQVKVSAEELSGIADRLKEMMAKFKT
jgi:methyl-accepting chemotaxis protein